MVVWWQWVAVEIVFVSVAHVAATSDCEVSSNDYLDPDRRRSPDRCSIEPALSGAPLGDGWRSLDRARLCDPGCVAGRTRSPRAALDRLETGRHEPCRPSSHGPPGAGLWLSSAYPVRQRRRG